MLLKRLTLVGFKSFADRTRLEFEPGVNVVVGPNGTGKSNILDALAWVMGTRATRALRSQRMEDVIFAGTASRPAFSRAEVSLTFDNEERLLPLDLAEVTITRRLYRDGTSEYEINGASCRLLDVQELLADAGVGRHQHVLVGQGQIAEIITARPEELRAVVEEAAGITKHRHRRDRALRRLEATEADLGRVEDLLREKRRLLRPLKRQADAAARHGRVKEELRALRLWLGGERLRELRRRLAEAREDRARLEQRLAADRAELEDLAGRLEGLRRRAGEVGRALERDTAAAARLETVSERLRRIGSVARERRLALETRIGGAARRTDDLRVEEGDLLIALEELVGRERHLRAEAERREEALRALEDEERSLAEQVGLPAEGLVASLRGDLRSLEAADQRDQHERAALEERRRVVGARIAEEEEELDELRRTMQATDTGTGEAQRRYEAAREARVRAQEAWEAADEARREAETVVAALRARVDAFAAALDGAVPAEVRDRVRGAEGILGAVVSRLDVPGELAAAVDGALGIWRDAFVAAADGPVRHLVETLKRDGLGGVAVVRRRRGTSTAREVAASYGVDALCDLLGPTADRDLAEALLGDVVLVEGWAAAWRIATDRPGIRVVTPEGDLLDGVGVAVARPDGSGPAALEAARAELALAETDLARRTSRHVSARRAFERARSEERQALEGLEALEARLSGHTEAMALVERARAESLAELSRIDERITAVDAAVDARRERLEELRARIGEMEGEEAARQEAWEALNRRREAVARRRDEARRAREEAATELAAVEERRRFLAARLDELRAELHQLRLLPDDDPRIGRLAAVEETADRAMRLVAGHLAALRERQRELRETGGEAGRALAAAEARRRELTEAVDVARDRCSVLSVEVAELEVRLEAVAEGLRRDADASEEEALAASRPDLPADVDPEARIRSLEADLRRMGPINPLAAAEYEELAADVALVEAQLSDLEGSRRELRKVVAALDDEMARLFREAFAEIDALFREHFATVFPGGRGRLRLIDPDAPLSTGVEVEAQPHGKRVNRLTLLSGGERSLAALAFLFAVFRARPSPFYVLDEVEAALDDANLRRFLRLVDTLRDRAQLVIITHQQQTMEAADILYGVTMEPGGSSKVVAKRIAVTAP